MGKDFFDSKLEPQKKSIVEQYEEILFKKPTEAPNGSLCALFCGEDGSGKSGLALSYLTKEDVDAGDKIVVVDMDSGNLPLISAYHMDDYLKGAIIHYDPLRWTEKDGRRSAPDYDATIQEVTNVGMTLQKTCKKNQVKLVILDGLSELLKAAEMKMRDENGLDDIKNTSFDFKYYKERRKTFGDTLKLYKALPVDKIFISHSEFILPKNPNPEKPPSAVKVDANAMAFQRVRFRAEESSRGNEKYYALIDKNKSNMSSVGEEICFAENMVDKKGNRTYKWNPAPVFEALKPIRK